VKAQALLREFYSERQFYNRVLVSEEKLIVLQLHIPTKSTRKRRNGGGLATDRLSSWPRNWRCLEELPLSSYVG
jgi:hypothetical protein